MNSHKSTQRPAVHAVVFDVEAGQWLELQGPTRVVVARTTDEVAACLEEVERAVQEGAGYAAGWVTYEAGPAFDAALKVKLPGPLPPLWFALFDRARPIVLPDAADQVVAREWHATVDAPGHRRAVETIRDYIRAGDTYQVNYTYRLNAEFRGDPWRAFLRLVAAQQDTYGAFIDAGDFVICSASPELYFRLDGSGIRSKPMKGTAARGLTLADDREQARALQASAKERAENVMIVDMVRHDLGRIATTGSVTVPRLFTVEKYPTIWTMTSTVAAQTDASLGRIFAATFPPSSITGAPKRRTMEIIDELETTPRGVYTGAVGFLAPHRVAQFNVAIRTLVFDRVREQVEYGVGSGIVWDSEPDREWQECQAKTRILTSSIRPFDLLETLKWSPETGYVLLDRHLERLRDSAEYFSCPVDLAAVRRGLERAVAAFGTTPMRVRVLVDGAANVRIETVALDVAAGRPARIALAARPIDATNRFLYHKTTHREVYDTARTERPECDDVVLYNPAGEVCETTIANIVVRIGGALYTPPVTCGLLPGTLRADMLARGEIAERVIQVAELAGCEDILLINSVRGVWPVQLVSELVPAA